MTSRERVIRALRHKEPDRVPIALTSSGFVREGPYGINALQQFMNTIGLKNYEQVLERVHSDIRWVSPWKYTGGQRIRNPNNPWNGALRRIETVSELNNVYWPSAEEVWMWQPEATWQEIRQAKAKGYAVMLYPGVEFYEMAGDMRGKEQFWVDLLLNSLLAEAILDKFLNLALQRAKIALKEFGKDIDLLGNCDDFGNQDQLQISPTLFREFIKPRLKKAINFERQYTDAFIFHHSCGSVYEVIPDLIEVGIDILNPVQVSANGMDIEILKKEFGKDICFYGAVDIQHICVKGTIEEIKLHVLKTFQTLGKHGGYILSPTHAIGSDVSPEKVIAIFDTAQKCKYF